MTANVFVIGIGSTLRGDDALGRIAACLLRERLDSQRVRVLDQSSLLPELAAVIAGASLVLVLDASVDGPPGEVIVRRESSESADPAGHACSVSMLLQLTQQLYGTAPPLYSVRCRVPMFQCADYRLSAEAERACAQMVDCVVRLLQDQSALADPP
ncbi:MAG: hydrogenase maturation protease [Pirellulaceae bacterium]